jgi:hypothetical protein
MDLLCREAAWTLGAHTYIWRSVGFLVWSGDSAAFRLQARPKPERQAPSLVLALAMRSEAHGKGDFS